MNHFEITSVNPVSAGRTWAVVGGILGILKTVFTMGYAVYFHLSGREYNGTFANLFWGATLDSLIEAVTAVIVGFVSAYIVSWLYNRFSKRIGGVRINVEEIDD